MPRPDPRWPDSLTTATGRFTSTATIHRLQQGTDPLGEPIEDWQQVDSCPCHPPVVNASGAAGGTRGGEIRRDDSTIERTSNTVLCAGRPDVDEGDRITVDGGTARRVVQVEPDHLDTTTRVLVEEIG